MSRYDIHARPDVLVVSSDAAAGTQLTKALWGAGFHAIQAGSYLQARRILSTELPRLLIADVRLGDFNGLNLAWHRELTFPGPSIITDVSHDPVLAAEARKLDAPYLVRPAADDILAVVFRILGAPVLAAQMTAVRSAHQAAIGRSWN